MPASSSTENDLPARILREGARAERRLLKAERNAEVAVSEVQAKMKKAHAALAKAAARVAKLDQALADAEARLSEARLNRLEGPGLQTESNVPKGETAEIVVEPDSTPLPEPSVDARD